VRQPSDVVVRFDVGRLWIWHRPLDHVRIDSFCASQRAFGEASRLASCWNTLDELGHRMTCALCLGMVLPGQRFMKPFRRIPVRAAPTRCFESLRSPGAPRFSPSSPVSPNTRCSCSPMGAMDQHSGPDESTSRTGPESPPRRPNLLADRATPPPQVVRMLPSPRIRIFRGRTCQERLPAALRDLGMELHAYSPGRS